jgi:hypothetical protein
LGGVAQQVLHRRVAGSWLSALAQEEMGAQTFLPRPMMQRSLVEPPKCCPRNDA